MKLQVIARWPISHGSDASVLAGQEFIFDQTVLDIPVRAFILRDERRYFAEYEFPVTDSLHHNLRETAEGDDQKLTKAQRTEVENATRPGVRLLRNICDLLRFHLNISSITHDVQIEHTLFFLADETAIAVPPRLGYFGRALNYESLNDTSAALIRKHLANDFKPFVAMRHLHRAHSEDEARHKWIDATIAAELAIKEFLIRKEPKFEALLLEVPAPPLSKLYGSILEAVIGEASPKRTQLIKGQEKRNKLVHRPGEEPIGHQEAIDYDLQNNKLPELL